MPSLVFFPPCWVGKRVEETGEGVRWGRKEMESTESWHPEVATHLDDTVHPVNG